MIEILKVREATEADKARLENKREENGDKIFEEFLIHAMANYKE